MGRFDKYRDDAEPTAPTGRFAKYRDEEPPQPTAPLGDLGLPQGWQGPPSVAQEVMKESEKWGKPIPIPAEASGRLIRDIDPKTGMLTLEPKKGEEVKSVLKTGKEPLVQSSAEVADFARRPIRDDSKTGRAFVAGALDAATLGFGDEAAALMSGGNYQRERDLNRRLIAESKAEDPTLALAGGILGGMSLAPLSMASAPAAAIAQGGRVAKTAKLLADARMLAEGTAIGGAAALGSSEAELAGKDKEIGKAAWDTVKGAGLGLGGTAAVLGGQKLANAVRTAPERIAAKDDQGLLDALMHRFPKAQRDEMIGPAGANRKYLLDVVKEDPELVAALRSGEKVDAAKILATKAEAEKRALDSLVGTASAERGPIPAQFAIGTLEGRANALEGSLAPSSAKTAKELAATAANIREEVLPVEGRALVSKVIKKAGADEKERVLRRKDDALAEMERLGIGKNIDDPELAFNVISSEGKAVGAELGEIRKQAGDIDLPKFAATITKAAQDLDRVGTAASALRYKDEAKAYIVELYRKYAPEMVSETGALRYQPGQASPKISFNDARRELTDLSDVAYNKLMPATPQEKARRAIAGDVRTFLEEQAAAKLPPDVEKRFRELNKRYSVLSDLANALSPASLEARAAPVASAIKPRTGTLGLSDVLAARNEATDEGVQQALGALIDSHLGKDTAGKLAAQEARARAVGQMAKSLDYQARDTVSMINPGLRGVAAETTGEMGRNVANASILAALASRSPSNIAAALALRLGVSGAPAKAADKLDRAVGAMVVAARKGADNKALARLGKMAGLGADVANDIALTISQRVAPTYVGKE